MVGGFRSIECQTGSQTRFGTQWWEDFARLASEGAASGDYSTVENHLHPGPGLAYGVIYGIFGIDCEHGCRSEVHPAYAVAIQVDESKEIGRASCRERV